MKHPRSKVLQNVLANLGSNVWVGLVTLVSIPWLIELVGLEGYGLIGVYLVLSNISMLFNAGLSTTLNCELARLSGAQETRGVRDTFRSLELVCWVMVVVTTVVLLASSPLISKYWLDARATKQHELLASISAMALAIALAIPFRLYVGGLRGLQRQVASGTLLAVVSTLRLVGGVLVLMCLQGGAATFFYWQILVSLIAVVAGRWQLVRHLPAARAGEGFSFQALRNLKGLMAGMTGVSITAVAFTQLDKIVLSKALTLSQFGQYSVAASIASGVVWLVNPVCGALFPRFTELAAARGRQAVIVDVFHTGSQLVALLVLPVCMTGAFFCQDALRLWAGSVADPTICRVLILLLLGNALWALLHVPQVLQLAHAWTGLILWSRLLAIAAMIPMTIFLAANYGPVGGAISWLVVCVTLVLVIPHFMHGRLLRGEKLRWYWHSVACPMAIAALGAAVGRYLTPQQAGGATIVAAVAVTWVIAGIGVAAVLPAARARCAAGWKAWYAAAPNAYPPHAPPADKPHVGN